ncbi:MAG: C40 family peptidase [Oscillospiraceae bacterium]|jgi:cell wall-associated NlpC family hydrolase|nr:C40 family peptidase [Oscillospiraceae bacterium]
MKKTLTVWVLLFIFAALPAGCGVSSEYGGYEYPAPSGTGTENLDNPPKPSERIERSSSLITETNGGVSVMPFEENQIVLTAQSLLGTPFADGGSTPDEGFDNSGFIHYVLRQNGYANSPRGLQEQAVMGNKIGSVSELMSGDLVFFSETGERATFGGIYIGDGIMISCRMPGETVREIDITAKYYLDSFYTGIRVL